MGAAFLATLRVAVRWGREFMELQQYGVATTGIVVDKKSESRRGARSSYIRYEYTDPFGRKHRRKVLVTPDAWESHQEGGPIEVIYSQRTPKISAPKYLIEVAAKQKDARAK